VKYSPENSTIELSAKVEAGQVVLEVADKGQGIHKKHHPRLFERFYRVDKARSRDMGGTGLGLAIVKHIAQVHKGHVDIDSIPGKGSRFFIIIPLKIK
jgi:two-component system phosphate regulon sensor histidine kinase PhoR